jgi:hypothetical protein
MLVIVFGVPMLEGALAPFLPAPFRPDLPLLVVFALALAWRNTGTGLVPRRGVRLRRRSVLGRAARPARAALGARVRGARA